MSTMTNRLHSVSKTNLSLTIVTLTSIYLVTRSLSKYGFTGSIRLIWEGDHLPPEIRVAVETLDNLENKAIPKQERKLEKIDCMIQLAKLNSVDNDDDDIENDGDDSAIINGTIDTTSKNSTRSIGSSSATISSSSSERRRHYIVSQTPQITNELSSLSYNLDNLAARVDEVLSHGDADLKRRKKELSTKLVEMMEKVDGFISECGVVVHPS